MTKPTITLLTLLTALGASAALAQDDAAMHCQARTLRGDSEYFQCLSRCDRRDARAAAQARPAAAVATNDCEARCEQRRASAMARISGTPPCVSVDATPDPSSCEARLLRIHANRLVCEARCANGGGKRFAIAACLARCDTRCGTAYDEAMAQGTCSAGRIGESPVCGDE
ncbi:hypothetical protein KF840_08825 [bacterium]|nr:hypothetical protein [bacterium]